MNEIYSKKSPELKCGDFILKLEMEELNESLKEKALLELRETPENIEKGVEELKKLLEAETQLNIPEMNNETWLKGYLRVCKYYPESARDLVKKFCNLRKKYAEVTNLLIPLKLKTVYDENLSTILPQRDQHGRRIVVTLTGKHWNTHLIPPDNLYSSCILCSVLLQVEPATQINGIVYILDMQGFSLNHALHYTFYRTKRSIDYIQGNTPTRVKGFHIVNQPKIFEPIFAAVRPFFQTKYAKRIILHGSNWKSLHKYIAPECLPECYGGTLKMPLMHSRETYELVSHYATYYEELQKFGYKNN